MSNKSGKCLNNLQSPINRISIETLITAKEGEQKF